jgi:heme oxygenase
VSVLEEIRQATKPIHDELEGGLDIVRRLTPVAERKSTLCGFHAIYSVAEAALLPQLRFVPDLEFERRLKVPALLNDLRALGVPAAERCFDLNATFPVLSCAEQALGFAYVLEGATLGGRVIRKCVVAAGGSVVGLSFFDVYGPATGDQWKRFCTVLERQCKSHVSKAVEGALAGFGFVCAALLDQGETRLTTGRVRASASGPRAMRTR